MNTSYPARDSESASGMAGEGQPPALPLKPHRGTTVLVLGILGLVFGCFGVILGPIAWVMGNNDLREMDQGIMDPAGRGNTQAGRICGIIAACWGALCSIFAILWFTFLAAAMTQGFHGMSH